MAIDDWVYYKILAQARPAIKSQVDYQVHDQVRQQVENPVGDLFRSHVKRQFLVYVGIRSELGSANIL